MDNFVAAMAPIPIRATDDAVFYIFRLASLASAAAVYNPRDVSKFHG